ncbi:MAG: DNA-binding response regulator [Homoserinimonas sp.]|nr:DNA-binding response regulator [Homoserinimonas sp.]
MYTYSGASELLVNAVEESVRAAAYPAALRALADTWPRISTIFGDRLRSLIASVPEGEWNDDPWIIAALGASYRSVGSPSRSAALPYFETAEKLASEDASSAQRLPAIKLHHAAALRSLGRWESALDKAESAWSLLEAQLHLPNSERVGLQAQAALQLGLTKLHLGDYESASVHLRLASGLGEEALIRSDLLECHAAMSFVAYLDGDFERAERFMRRARVEAADSALLASGFGVAALITETLIAVRRMRVSDALALAPQLREGAHRSDWEPLALYAEASISIVTGNYIEGLELLRRARACVRQWQSTAAIKSLLGTLQGRLLMHLGEFDTAMEIIETMEPSRNHETCPARFVAGIRFRQGDTAGCLEALSDCETLGEDHSSRTLTDVLLLSAAAHYELGQLSAGDVAFDRVLYIGSTTGMRLPFLSIPPVTMRRMLGRASDRNQPPTVHVLLDELRNGPGGQQHGGFEPLSQRELDIAQHMFLDKTVSQIAAELFISANTVKTHLRSIYRKLDASNRKEAIRRVQELGLDLEITPF